MLNAAIPAPRLGSRHRFLQPCRNPPVCLLFSGLGCFYSAALLSSLGDVVDLFVIIEQDAAVRQGEIGEEMVGADDAADREVSDRRVDMWHQMQTAGSNPGTLHDNIDQVDRDQLAN